MQDSANSIDGCDLGAMHIAAWCLAITSLFVERWSKVVVRIPTEYYVPHTFDDSIRQQGWAENDRGVSYVFGADVVEDFLERHDLDLIVRAHQVVEDGYEFFAGRRLVTLFSAPNYCGEFDNAGAMISIDENLMCSFQILKPSEKKHRYAHYLQQPCTEDGSRGDDQPHLL